MWLLTSAVLKKKKIVDAVLRNGKTLMRDLYGYDCQIAMPPKHLVTLSTLTTRPVTGFRLYKNYQGVHSEHKTVPLTHQLMPQEKQFFGYLYKKPLISTGQKVVNLSGASVMSMLSICEGAYVKRLRPWHFSTCYIVGYFINKYKEKMEPYNVNQLFSDLIRNGRFAKYPSDLIQYLIENIILKEDDHDGEPSFRLNERELRAWNGHFETSIFREEMQHLLKYGRDRYEFDKFSCEEASMKLHFGLQEVAEFKLPKRINVNAFIYADNIRLRQRRKELKISLPDDDVSVSEDLRGVDDVPDIFEPHDGGDVRDDTILIHGDQNEVVAEIRQANKPTSFKQLIYDIIGVSSGNVIPDNPEMEVAELSSATTSRSKRPRIEKQLHAKILQLHSPILVRINHYSLHPGRYVSDNKDGTHVIETYEIADAEYYWRRHSRVHEDDIYPYSKNVMYADLNNWYSGKTKPHQVARFNYQGAICDKFVQMLEEDDV